MTDFDESVKEWAETLKNSNPNFDLEKERTILEQSVLQEDDANTDEGLSRVLSLLSKEETNRGQHVAAITLVYIFLLEMAERNEEATEIIDNLLDISEEDIAENLTLYTEIYYFQALTSATSDSALKAIERFLRTYLLLTDDLKSTVLSGDEDRFDTLGKFFKDRMNQPAANEQVLTILDLLFPITHGLDWSNHIFDGTLVPKLNGDLQHALVVAAIYSQQVEFLQQVRQGRQEFDPDGVASTVGAASYTATLALAYLVEDTSDVHCSDSALTELFETQYLPGHDLDSKDFTKAVLTQLPRARKDLADLQDLLAQGILTEDDSGIEFDDEEQSYSLEHNSQPVAIRRTQILLSWIKGDSGSHVESMLKTLQDSNPTATPNPPKLTLSLETEKSVRDNAQTLISDTMALLNVFFGSENQQTQNVTDYFLDTKRRLEKGLEAPKNPRL